MSWRMIEVPKVFNPLGPIFLKLNGCLSVLLLVPSTLKVEAAIIPPRQSKLPMSRLRFMKLAML